MKGPVNFISQSVPKSQTGLQTDMIISAKRQPNADSSTSVWITVKPDGSHFENLEYIYEVDNRLIKDVNEVFDGLEYALKYGTFELKYIGVSLVHMGLSITYPDTRYVEINTTWNFTFSADERKVYSLYGRP